MKPEAKNYPPCKFCGSEHTRRFGFTILGQPYRKVQRYQCKDCGRVFYNPEEETPKCQTTESGS